MRRILLAMLLWVGGLVVADVFLRQPADIPGTWQRMYHSPMRLQNSKGELTLYHATDNLRLIEISLRNRHGEDLAWVQGEVMAWAMAVQDGWLHRYLVQPLPEGGFWISHYRQPLRSAGSPGDPPDRHQLRELPPLPQSEPTFYSYDEGNQLSVEISTCSASPESALATLSQLVESDGWKPSPVNTGGFQVFVRGEKVAFLGAQRGKDGITRILRLHKPLGVK